jgi:hypothetical protein
MACAIQLFAGCLFIIGDSEQKQPRPVINIHCLSEVWMLICLPSETIGFRIREE